MGEEIKNVIKLAEKELEDEKLDALKNRVKAIVKGNLEEIDRIDKQIDDLNKKKQLLKKDIEDLKKGRLDLIEERQKTDRTIVFPYIIHTTIPNSNPYFGTYTISMTAGNDFTSRVFNISGQMMSRCVQGSYVLPNGRIVHIN